MRERGGSGGEGGGNRPDMAEGGGRDEGCAKAAIKATIKAAETVLEG